MKNWNWPTFSDSKGINMLRIIPFVVVAVLAFALSDGAAQTLAGHVRTRPPSPGLPDSILFAFHKRAGWPSLAGLSIGADGSVYGLTLWDYRVRCSMDSFGCGTIFRLRPSASGYTPIIVHAFTNGADGGHGQGQPIPDAGGVLYGAADGGAQDYGIVYAFSPNGRGYNEQIVWSFTNGGDGEYPHGPLLLDKRGVLWGTFLGGTDFPCGGVFTLTSTGSSYYESTIYGFANGAGDGCEPTGGLLETSDGKFFGTTSRGGTYGFGTVFELSKKNDVWSEQIVHNFQNVMDGANPNGQLAQDANGTIFGTTPQSADGFGLVYALVPSGSTYQERILHVFDVRGGPMQPNGQLAVDVHGNVYGTTYNGSNGRHCNEGCGVVFELSPTGSTYAYSVLHHFMGESRGDLGNPQAGLAYDGASKLFGTTTVGGSSSCAKKGCGGVYSITLQSAGRTTRNR